MAIITLDPLCSCVKVNLFYLKLDVKDEDAGAACELLRQREKLERSVARLQSVAARQEAVHKSAKTQLVKVRPRPLTY